MLLRVHAMKPAKKMGKILLIVLLALMFATSIAAAEGETANIQVFRLSDRYIGLKIEFTSDLSSDFAGYIYEKHFECLTIPTNTLYCIGPIPTDIEFATLHIYSYDSQSVILSQIIHIPPTVGHLEEIPVPPAIQECQECEIPI